MSQSHCISETFLRCNATFLIFEISSCLLALAVSCVTAFEATRFRRSFHLASVPIGFFVVSIRLQCPVLPARFVNTESFLLLLQAILTTLILLFAIPIDLIRFRSRAACPSSWQRPLLYFLIALFWFSSVQSSSQTCDSLCSAALFARSRGLIRFGSSCCDCAGPVSLVCRVVQRSGNWDAGDMDG